MVTFDALKEAIIVGDETVVVAEVNKALAEGADAGDIMTNGLIGGMGVVGKRFSSGEMFLPEVLLSAEVMHKGLTILDPLLAAAGKKGLGKIVMVTVEGDIHDIGKRIVGFLLEGNGFDVTDLGVDIKADDIIKAVEEHKPDILGMSALLTTTMPHMAEVINMLKERNLRDKTKVIVGGASVNDQFAQSIGADGYAPEAGSTVEWVKKALKV